MAGPAKNTARKATLRSVPSSQATPGPSSGTTVQDDTMNLIHELKTQPTPQSTQMSARIDVSRLSQSLEPFPIRNSQDTPRITTSIKASALGADAIEVKEAIAAVSKLEGLGLDEFDIRLPKIYTIGDQSSGKSSLVERLSNIKTPRSSDTCTRCPISIKMEPADPGAQWAARVSIRTDYEWVGLADRSTGCKYRGWLKAPLSEFPFASTNSEDHLEDLIARAQLAILSGSEIEHDQFLHDSIASLDSKYRVADFSPNVVCVTVSAPGLLSLSLYDLPGIIGQSEDASNHFLVKFVKDLVTEYIMDPEALIVVACSLGNDIHNSTAAGMARDLNITDRCIGVLTKPDRVPAGSRTDKLQAVLDGRSFQLGHGYFVVKNLAQDAINQGLTNYDAQIQECHFFENTALWGTSFQRYQHLFGTDNLRSYLSKTLATRSIRALPDIQRSINTRLLEVEADLNKNPESPTHDAVHVVLGLLREFSRHVEMEIDGEYKHDKWVNFWKQLRHKFFKGLEELKPQLITNGTRDKGLFLSYYSPAGHSVDDPLTIDDESEVEDHAMSPTSESASKKRKRGADTRSHTSVKSASIPNASSSKPRKTNATGKAVKYNLDSLVTRVMATSNSKTGLLQPKVLDGLIIETMNHWDQPLKQFFLELRKNLEAQLRTIFDRHFNRWRDSELYRAAWEIVEGLVSNHLEEQECTMSVEALNDERKGPHTFHKDVWEQEQVRVREKYRQARYSARVRIFSIESDEAAGRPLSCPPASDEEGRKLWQAEREAKAKKDERIHALISKEPYAEVLENMTMMTGYYNMASRRFHESIYMRIESKFFYFLKTELYGELAQGLHTGGEEGHGNCVHLLAADSTRQGRRRDLLRAKRSLLEGQKLLDGIGKKYGDDSSRLPNGLLTNGNGSSGSFASAYTPHPDEMLDITYSGRYRR